MPSWPGSSRSGNADDPPELFAQMLSQYQARRQAHLDAVEAEKAVLAKAQQDLSGALETASKLEQTLPIYQDQERSWTQLHKEGFAGRLLVEDRKRVRIEAEQELKTQTHAIAGLRAAMQQSRKHIAQLESNYRQVLYNERVDATAQAQKSEQDWQKQSIRQDALELKAPQDGVVKDLATHTEGAVLSPGTVLMTIVPAEEPLRAEVWISNEDRGFVREGQTVRLKIRPYPFQKYGMVEGVVQHVSADATEQPRARPRRRARRRTGSAASWSSKRRTWKPTGCASGSLLACRWMPRSRWATARCWSTSCHRCARRFTRRPASAERVPLPKARPEPETHRCARPLPRAPAPRSAVPPAPLASA